MNFGISKKELAITLAFSSAIAIIAGIVSTHASDMLFLLLPSIAFAYIVRLLIRHARHAYESNIYKRHLFDVLERLNYYVQKGLPLVSAIDLALTGESETITRRMRVAKRELLLGLGLEDVLYRLDLAYGKSDLASSLEAHKAHDERHAAELEGSMQTYATLNMFVSTIAPSFIVFAFIGSTVIAGSLNGLFAMSLALLFLVPLAYAFANVLMYRRMYAQ
ncbi:MAG: hypothetical protein QW091_00605 [Candidatus Micrarchaeaceae archaeon]